MKEKKLFFLLKNLSKKEFKELRKAILSPLFNTNPKVSILFDLIRGQYPDFDNSLKGRQKLFSKIFPKLTYSDQRLRRVFSDLTKVVERFYVFLEVEKDDFRQKTILKEAYGVRNMFDYFEGKTKELLEELGAEELKSGVDYLKEMTLYKAFYFHPRHNKYNIKDTTLGDLSDSLDAFFILSKLQIGLALQNSSQILNKNYSIRFFDITKQEEATILFEQNPLFQLFLLANEIVTNPSLSTFEAYEELLFQNLDFLDSEDQRILFYNGLNQIIREYNKGNIGFQKIGFRWFKFGLECELLFQNKQLTAITFNNIVLFACRAQAFDWVKQFIQENQIYLKEDNREEEALSCIALVHFFKGEYDEVISKLSNYSFSIKYILRNRTILIRTYFELFLIKKENFFMLSYGLNSFESYLKKTEAFSEHRIETYLNLVRILRGLTKKILKREAPKSLKSWLKKQLELRKNVSSKKWLISKYGLEDIL